MSETNGRYNADELQPPQWLNKDFFTKLLRVKKENENIKINKITITPGTTKSDHYASIMFRAKLNYTSNVIDEEQRISLIIKTTPIVEGQKKELLEKFVIFETEIKMYTETIPKIEQILRSHGDDTKLCANLFYASLEPYKCMIFEDLCELGYMTINNRHANMTEVKMALLKLAKLHAVSFKLAQEGDASITSFKDGSFNDRKILDFPLAGNAIKNIKEVLAEISDLAYFVPYFEKIEKQIFENIFSTFNAYQNGERNGILVLNHGDFHMKNMMIREKAGKLEDLMLVDYQISVFATAAVDVMYAIMMLFSPDMRLNHRDELIFYYFTSFQKTLKLIEYQGKMPTLIDFQQELLKHSHWELFLFVSFLIFNYVFTDADGDLTKSIEDENYRREFYKKPEVLEEFRAILPRLLYKGCFDL